MIELRNIDLGYQGKTVVNDLNITLLEKGITSIVGPNGSGKSTILKAIARILGPTHGKIFLNGSDIHSCSSKKVAQKLSMLPQAGIAPTGINVKNLVSFGRFPYQGWFENFNSDDKNAVEKAMKNADISDLAERQVESLSGGQRQRVWLAMALAQETEYILLDEPTTFLDLEHQLELMDLINTLKSEMDKKIIMVLHDLNLAARYSDIMVVLSEGTVIAQGTPQEIMCPEIIRKAFRVDVEILKCSIGHPLCLPRKTAAVTEAANV